MSKDLHQPVTCDLVFAATDSEHLRSIITSNLRQHFPCNMTFQGIRPQAFNLTLYDEIQMSVFSILVNTLG